ncbi:RkpR, polysaccharide export protein [Ensifer adhaerens]|uniref:RkpR, polysaccharide export protein n=1 Tax=Ensifer canadensis TaxID=555315 RepID=UPI00149013EB|nr:RkpR, polysaccharide export protein [Ensifer canadensis]NOV21630.1 RkpR, polysaccharide export protein [Ensifer canadensis]
MAAKKDVAIGGAESAPPTEVRAQSAGVSKSKGLAVLEGLLGKESIPVIPLRPHGEKLERITKERYTLAWLNRFKLRHKVIGATFIAFVALPAAFASVYMAFVAAEQYHSSASFAVRSIDAAGTSDILGMFTQASSGNTVSDSYILMDYILSERMVMAADRRFNLEGTYRTRGVDYYYGIGAELPVEEKLAYWRNMVTVSFDHASGIMQVTAKAFSPKQATEIAKFIVERSDDLVNGLSLSARNDVLRAAQDEVLAGEARLAKARIAIREYRDRAQEVDPVEGAKLALQLVGALEQQVTQLNADLATAKSQMDDDTPRVRVLKARIKSLEEQIAVEKQRLGAGDKGLVDDVRTDRSHDVAGRIQQFEELETEREFAERAYTASLVSLEKARLEANNRQRYLALFIEPTISELAQYPARLLNSLLVTLGLIFAWGVGVMGYYNIRDRA